MPPPMGSRPLAFQLISLADDDAYTGADAYAEADTATASFLHATGQAKQVAGATPMPELLTTFAPALCKPSRHEDALWAADASRFD